ncbi:MAG: EAL domain-containing protein [Limnothrix sp.]
MLKYKKNFKRMSCQACQLSQQLDFDFTMALQPIVNTKKHEIFAHEALVRGLNGESAGSVFSNVTEQNRYRFDQSCRVKAIELAAGLDIPCFLNINFLPNAVYDPELCIRTTLETAERYKLPISQIIFEITESEKIEDISHLKRIVEYYKKRGFKTAIDDFGAGYAGLNLLSEIQTDFIKLDMALVRGIDQDSIRQAIVKGVLQVSNEISSTIIAEGVETQAELAALESLGIELFQGFYFAKPCFQALADVTF